MENLDLLTKKLSYSVKKLVAVNSISFCYVELPIDQHCALFGRNNLGKTSLLNVLKLHLFPEISFNDCQNKFAFKSSKGELYAGDDSYLYYFPSDSSFLILEAENIHGCFCLILFKSNSSFGYQRLALPCAYDEIREQFWDIEQQTVNNGLGSPVSDLGLAKITSLYKQYKSQGAVILKSTKEIKDKLFSHYPLQPEKGRFCLVPLKEGGVSRELSAFRQLMNFTFEIAKTDTRSLTETFATIIESSKINTQDRLHQDLQQILDEYESLRKAESRLKNISQYEAPFQQLDNTSRSLNSQQNDFSCTYHAYGNSLQQSLVHLNGNIKQQDVVKDGLRTEKSRLEVSDKELETTLSEYKGQLISLNKEFQTVDKKAQQYRVLQKEYPNVEDAEIKEILAEHAELLVEKVENLKSAERATEQLRLALLQQKTKRQERHKKQVAIEQSGDYLIHQLGEHSSLVLANLSPLFAEVTTVADQQQRSAIENFTSLFSTDNNQLHFLAETFGTQALKSPQEIINQWKRELEQLEAELFDLDTKVNELVQISKNSGEQQQAELGKTEDELQVVKDDLIVLHTVEETSVRWAALKEELARIEQDRQCKQRQREDNKEQLGGFVERLAGMREALEADQHQQRLLTQLQQRLLKLKPLELMAGEPVSVPSVSASDLDELEGESVKLSSMNEKLVQQFNDFIQCGHFELPIDVACNYYDQQQQEQLLEALRTLFVALPEQLATLASQVIEHNKMTGTKISELAGNRQHIRAFVNKINKQFNHYSISNLQEIRVEIELDSRFEALVDELNNTNLNTTDIHDDGLYQRLNSFCEDFFTGHHGNRILEVSKIIKNVKYSYIKQHQDKREDKDQSTGTNALINCTLLTILLSDLLSQDSQLTLPIIFDEFTALDEYNQRTAIKVASEHGFSLFCASPTDTAEVVSVVDYYIHLDDFHVDTLYDAAGERDIVFHHFQERLYELTEQAE